ncbi:MAG: glutathione synthase/RimK-type ligase-like ATP-grasp enzyme [Arenicella sp.]|jgi:glutathione synthase/RimK-type ligase-like ATP-grasp enzyme
MAKYDIAILTEAQYVNPSKTDWYIDQILKEDGMLQKELEDLGYSVAKLDWSDSKQDWSEIKMCVFRTIWDYFHRYEEFSQWMKEVKSKTTFVNPIEQIIWNIDKHYLKELGDDGVPIVESYFIEKGETRTLNQIHIDLGWTKTVLKPCVSGGARHTYLIKPENVESHETIFSELIAKEAFLLQPFIESITEKGEVSHIVIAGEYTHSILKKAKSGDYRVQDDFGGSVEDYKASVDEIEFAEKVAKSCTPLPAYARVDVVWDNNNNLAVGEVELIEPELWFRDCPESAKKLAQEIDRRFKTLA